ncbi:hypothetical protein pb186bvf_012403 [Paramecium bursaria]
MNQYYFIYFTFNDKNLQKQSYELRQEFNFKEHFYKVQFQN